MSTPENSGRRPLKSRGTAWARGLAQRLAATSVTPNRISQAGLAAGLLAGGVLALLPHAGAAQPVALLAAAAFIQLRLLCNLLDGMVAVEGGKAAPDGAFWNELPDRIADIAIIVGAGIGAGAMALGWAAAALAVLTAYVRVLGEALTGRSDFGGPMAKQHRMALLTGAILLVTALPTWRFALLEAALWATVVGCGLTAIRRCGRLHARLKEPPAGT